MTTRSINIGGRPCPELEDSGIEGAYTRAELVRLLLEETDLHEEHITALPMKRLCNLLQQARAGLPVHVRDADRGYLLVGDRPCGNISLREYPDAFTKDEVVDLLTKEYDLIASRVKKLPVSILCGYLKLHHRGQFAPPDELRRPTHILLRGRPCGPDHSAEGAYSNEELRTLALMDLNIPTKIYDRYSADDKRRLCNRLKALEARRRPSRRRRAAGEAAPSTTLPDEGLETELLRRSLARHKRWKLEQEKKRRAEMYTEEMDEDLTEEEYSTSPGEEAEWLSSESSIELEDEDECISASRVPLKDHQKRLVRFLQSNRGAIAAFGVGTGKTLTAVTAAECFLRSNPGRQVLVVTPTSLQANFKKELAKYGATQPYDRYAFFTIEGFVMAVREGRAGCEGNMLIIDEAHNLRTMVKEGRSAERQAAAVAVQCAKRAARVLLLTATPIVDRPEDLNNLIAMARGEDPMTKAELAQALEDPATLGCLFFFHEKKEEGPPGSPQFPRKSESVVPITMTPQFESMYEAVEKGPKTAEDRREAYEKVGRNRFLALFGKTDLKQFYNGVRTAANALDFTLNPKIAWIVEMVTSHPADKFVIYTSFVDKGIELVASGLRRAGVPYMTVTGSMTGAQREAAVAAYNSKRVRVLLISAAGGEGLDLKETKHIIITEPAWNETAVEQIIGRGVRFLSHATLPGPEREVQVHRLVLLKQHEMAALGELTDMTYSDFKDWSADQGKVPSIDLYVMKLAKEKETRYSEVLQRFRAASAAMCPQ